MSGRDAGSGEGSGIEVEFKLGIPGPEAFEALLARVTSDSERLSPISQTNHFFDTRALDLSRAGYICRLREIENAYVLTLKGPARQLAPLLSRKAEREWTVNALQARELLSGSRSPLDVIEAQLAPRALTGRGGSTAGKERALVDAIRSLVSGAVLVHVGSFRNLRYIVDVPWDLGTQRVAVRLEFDASEFPDGSRYEVELEIPADSVIEPARYEARLMELFRERGIEPVAHSSKSERFFAAIRARNA